MTLDDWYFGLSVKVDAKALCQHNYIAAYDQCGQYLQATCSHCGDVIGSGAERLKEYSEGEIERIRREAFAAGQAKAREEWMPRPVAVPLPIHRAMARQSRIEDVFAHRVYWLPSDDEDSGTK